MNLNKYSICVRIINCDNIITHIPSKRINNSPTDAVNAAPQLMFTVRAYKVLALTVLTADDVAKKVGSSLVAK